MSERKSLETVSHGRGGAGNIGADDTPYVDGEIVRVGTPGDHGDGAYSSGRGGQGNIGSPGKPHSVRRNDQEIIPPFALRQSEEQDHHVGRGGQGNVVKRDTGGEKKHPTGLADKLKNKLFGAKKAKTPEPTSTDGTAPQIVGEQPKTAAATETAPKA